ncbi:hypothetical protein ACS0TY_025688 [Phlomoides rotata]
MEKFVGAAAIEVAKCSAEPIKRQFNYLCCFNTNIRNLRDEAKKLDDAKVGLEGQVDAARRNTQVILPRVETWLDDVNKIQANMMSAIEPEILNVKSRCLAIKSRFSLSRKATKMVAAMQELQDDHGKFGGQISHPPPPPAMAPSIPLGQTYELQSRKNLEEDIMVSLREKNVSVMGICGMGGVGKTTMAKKLMSRARGEDLFSEILMVVVSQPVDMLRIQKEMAELLSLKLDVESVPARAYLLRTRLMNSKSILIILDDLWKKLNLEDLGIPDQRELKECTILLTSRDNDVFTAMNVEKRFQMETLEAEEAWSLFKEKVGACADDQSLFSTAREIVQECKGLPIALVTVSEALKDKTSKFIWEDAVQELKSCNPRDIPYFLAQVYIPLKLSFDMLESEHARSILLMCCLFPEDHKIRVSDLSLFAWGLGMFEGITSVQVARNKVQTLVELLKSRSLLLDCFDVYNVKEHRVKIHDVVRDVGIFIAAKEGWMDPNLSWKREESKCSWISLFDADKTTLPGGSKFPNLRLLLIVGPRSTMTELPPCDNFFESARNLGVLSIRYYSFKSLPHTIQLLKNLRTLILFKCSFLVDLSIVCELASLEILYCYGCYSINELPGGIGRLNQLKLLDISYCSNLETIPAGVISRLIRLEELTLIESFKGWESGASEGKNAGLCELNSLSSLTTLRIEIEDASLAAEQIHLSPNLVDFHVLIGKPRKYDIIHSRRIMQVELEREVIIGDWIHQLLRTTESLLLEGEGSNKLVPFLPEFQSLKWLDISENVKVTRLIDGRSTTHFPLLEFLCFRGIDDLEEIHKGPISLYSFSNLQELFLDSLPKLQHLGNNYLLRLKRLSIWCCSMLEQVVLWNEEEHLQSSRISFPKLEELSLYNLPRLTSFSRGIQSIEFPLLTAIRIEECRNLKNLVSSTGSGHNKCSGAMKHDDDDSLHFFCKSKVAIGRLKNLIFGGSKISRLWCDQISMDIFIGLVDMTIGSCDNIKSLFSLSIATHLVNLESLNIKSCSMIEQVVVLWDEEESGQSSRNHRRITFPKLKTLWLWNLPRLTSFCKGIQTIQFPLLMEMEIKKCPNLKSLVSSTENDKRCSGAINHEDDDLMHLFCKSQAVFGRLGQLEIGGYDNIKSLWCDQIPMEFFTGLVDMTVSNCDNIKSLFSLSIDTYLVNLESLEIMGCSMIEQVVLLWDEEEESGQSSRNHHRITFPKLKALHLLHLPRLTSFCKGIQTIQFPLLTKMEIMNCPNLKSLVSSTENDKRCSGAINHEDDDDSFHLFCKSQDAFGRLDQLEIDGYDSIKSLWCDQIPMEFFTGLVKLTVSNCGNIESLFSLSIARNLINLRYLRIESCSEMVKVVEDKFDEVERCPFNNLEDLHLMELPKMNVFCDGRCFHELALQEKVYIDECPEMERLHSP